MADKDGRNGKQGGGIIGSLREALAAASKEDTNRVTTSANRPQADDIAEPGAKTVRAAEKPAAEAASDATPPPLPSAADAAREARGGTPNIPPVETAADRHVEFEPPPTTRVVRQAAPTASSEDSARTQLVRGRPQVERGEFRQDPVVGWLVVVGGPGIGSYRPIFEGNNTIGRTDANRIPIDFGDDTISSEEQAYIRYDSANRAFLFVPNMTKTNIVSVNDDQPTSAIRLQNKDVIRMGRTQLVFVAFCGQDFDWSELAELK